MFIRSNTNSTIKEVFNLKKASVRKERGEILIDGRREILAAVAAGWSLNRFFYCADLVGDNSDRDVRSLGSVARETDEVSEAVFRKICYKENPDGFLAVAARREAFLSDLVLSAQPLLIVLEGVEKPGNLGAILRTAYAAGVEAIIINDSQTDIFNPNVIRASEGEIFRLPVIKAEKKETVSWLEQHKIKMAAAATTGGKSYASLNLKSPVALIFGSEAKGLSDFWLSRADELVKIPMRPGLDSLNVSVAAAIIMFEALRQRG